MKNGRTESESAEGAFNSILVFPFSIFHFSFPNPYNPPAMIRTAWVAVVAFVATLVCAPMVIVISLFGSHSPLIDRAVKYWARSIVLAAGMRISIDQQSEIDWSSRYILIANHHSYLDIPTLLCTIPQPVRFMAKKTLFQVPLFGWGLRAAGFIPIDRKDRSKAAASFGLAADRIRKGNTIVVFPEGGRSREYQMKEFKRGAYLLAMKSKLPLLPAAIVGTYEAMPATRLRIRPGPVVVRLGEPIDTLELSVREVDGLISRTRDLIGKMREERGTENDELPVDSSSHGSEP